MMEPCRQLWLGGFFCRAHLHTTHEHEGQRQRLEALSTVTLPRATTIKGKLTPECAEQMEWKRSAGKGKPGLLHSYTSCHRTYSPLRGHTPQSPGAHFHGFLTPRAAYHCMLGILSEAVCECPSPKAHSGEFPVQPSCKLMLFSPEPLGGGITSVRGMCRGMQWPHSSPYTNVHHCPGPHNRKLPAAWETGCGR